jgi:hypothetical protein
MPMMVINKVLLSDCYRYTTCIHTVDSMELVLVDDEPAFGVDVNQVEVARGILTYVDQGEARAFFERYQKFLHAFVDKMPDIHPEHLPTVVRWYDRLLNTEDTDFDPTERYQLELDEVSVYVGRERRKRGALIQPENLLVPCGIATHAELERPVIYDCSNSVRQYVVFIHTTTHKMWVAPWVASEDDEGEPYE